MDIRGGPVRVLRWETNQKMLIDQHSIFLSRQSCSQSVAGDDGGALVALHFADDEQLWLTYKAMERTVDRCTLHF
jgi:hypothetical protein